MCTCFINKYQMWHINGRGKKLSTSNFWKTLYKYILQASGRRDKLAFCISVNSWNQPSTSERYHKSKFKIISKLICWVFPSTLRLFVFAKMCDEMNGKISESFSKRFLDVATILRLETVGIKAPLGLGECYCVLIIPSKLCFFFSLSLSLDRIHQHLATNCEIEISPTERRAQNVIQPTIQQPWQGYVSYDQHYNTRPPFIFLRLLSPCFPRFRRCTI